MKEKRRMKNKWKLIDNEAIMYIQRRNGERHEVLLDDFDMYRLFHLGYTWHVHGNTEALPYVGTSIEGKKTQLHRYILNAPEDVLVDHINGNPLDNRKKNLRLVDHKGNAQNRTRLSSHNTSGYRGVWYDEKSEMWKVSIGIDNKQLDFGSYADINIANYVAMMARKNLMPHSKEAKMTETELKEASNM